jgi:hypothetical protein
LGISSPTAVVVGKDQLLKICIQTFRASVTAVWGGYAKCSKLWNGASWPIGVGCGLSGSQVVAFTVAGRRFLTKLAAGHIFSRVSVQPEPGYEAILRDTIIVVSFFAHRADSDANSAGEPEDRVPSSTAAKR